MLHENSENLTRFINMDKELSSIYQKQSKKFEISETTILILYAIRASENGITQKEIIDEYLLPKQTVNSAMKKLLDEGKVFVSEKNGREKRFLLTKEGIHMASKRYGCYGVIDDLGLPRLEKMLKKYPRLKIAAVTLPLLFSGKTAVN